LVRVHAVSVNRTLGYGVVLPLILGEAFLQARHLDDRTVSEAVVQSRSCLHDGSNDVPKRLLLKDASGDHALDIIVFSGGLDRARGTLVASWTLLTWGPIWVLAAAAACYRGENVESVGSTACDSNRFSWISRGHFSTWRERESDCPNRATFDALRVRIDLDLSKVFPHVPELFLKLVKPHFTIWITRREPY
jgi:hypothetical protein